MRGIGSRLSVGFLRVLLAGVIAGGVMSFVGARVWAAVTSADITCDGRVDLDDYTVLVQHWGLTGQVNAGC